MNVFRNYAFYYDFLYKDKNYEQEADYIDSLIQRYLSGAKVLLELGSGTGKHAILLAKKGYDVCGVDISKEMVALAEDRRGKECALRGCLNFSCNDLRSLRLNKKFDVVISLFHVISYQVTNEDLYKTFQTVNQHLDMGGVFIFDCWYGPAVLTDRPSVRIKRLEDDKIKLTRIAEPRMYANTNVIDVNYQIYIHDKQNKKIETVQEVHRMRYLFKPEIEMIMKQNGFELIDFEGWLTGNEPGVGTWSVCFICKKNG